MPNQLPGIGTNLIAFKRKPNRSIVRATIVAHPDSARGSAVLFDGKVYDSLTSAARAATGYETNGWLWWKNEDGSLLNRESTS